MRQFSGCGRRLKEKTTMRFLEKTIQELVKVDLRIHIIVLMLYFVLALAPDRSY